MAGLIGSELSQRYRIISVGTVSGRPGPLRHAAFPLALVRLGLLAIVNRPAGFHVHTASWGSFPRKRIVIALAHLAAIPVILHIHGGGFLQYMTETPRRSRAVRKTLERCAGVIVVSRALREPLVAAVPGVPVWVVPNAVEIPPGSTSGIDSDTAVFAGRLVSEKGLAELLSATRRVVDRVPSFRLTIAGCDEGGRLADQLMRSGLQHHVDLPGWLDRRSLEGLYARSALFLLPSHVEAMPLSLLEGMSHGLACVATPVGAIPSVISDGKNGVLVPPRDSAALASAIELLLLDGELRKRLGRQARETIARHYSVTVAAAQVEEVYAACGLAQDSERASG